MTGTNVSKPEDQTGPSAFGFRSSEHAGGGSTGLYWRGLEVKILDAACYVIRDGRPYMLNSKDKREMKQG